MQYQEAVAEARTLVKRSEEDQWRLAQLSWEQTRQHGVAVQKWADDIGVHFSTVYRWREMWTRFGQAETRPKYQDAYSAIRVGGEVDPEDAPTTRHQEIAKGAIRSLPPEQKAEVVREALQDQVVAKQVMEDVPTAAAVSRAHEDVAREREARVERVHEERFPGTRQTEELFAHLRSLYRARGDVAMVVDFIRRVKLSDDHRQQFVEAFREIVTAGQWGSDFLETGDQSFEDELAELLGGES